MNFQDFISVQDMADKWDVSVRQVQKMCSTNKIPGAIRFGNAWAIPSGTLKPTITRRTKPGPKKKTENEQEAGGDGKPEY